MESSSPALPKGSHLPCSPARWLHSGILQGNVQSGGQCQAATTSIWLPQPLQILMYTESHSKTLGSANSLSASLQCNSLICFGYFRSAKRKPTLKKQVLVLVPLNSAEEWALSSAKWASKWVKGIFIWPHPKVYETFRCFQEKPCSALHPAFFWLSWEAKSDIPCARPSLSWAAWDQPPFHGKGLAGIWDFKCRNWSYGKQKDPFIREAFCFRSCSIDDW